MKTKPIYSNSFVDFLEKSETKLAKILFRLNERNHVNIVNADSVNYITFRNDGTISYLPNGKDCVYTSEGTWSKENRQNGKPSKVIRKLFNERSIKLLKLKDADFESFTNDYKSAFNEDGFYFDILDNSHIKSIYDEDDIYNPDGGCSLHNSCMKGNSEYLDIYSNCDDLSIVVLKNKEGLLSGRALLWNVEIDGEKVKFIDRFYVAKECLYNTFLDFANKNKFWRKEDYKSYQNKTRFVDPDGESRYIKIKIYTNTDFNCYPYIDTFSYGSDGFLTNESGFDYEYNNTDGTRDGDGMVWDDIYNCYIHEEDSAWITSGEGRYINCRTHIENVVEIDNEWYYYQDENIVEIDGEWYTIDSGCVVCVCNGGWELIDNCAYSEYDGEWYLLDDCVYSESMNDYILTYYAVEIDGKWYHIDSDEAKELQTV